MSFNDLLYWCGVVLQCVHSKGWVKSYCYNSCLSPFYNVWWRILWRFRKNFNHNSFSICFQSSSKKCNLWIQVKTHYIILLSDFFSFQYFSAFILSICIIYDVLQSKNSQNISLYCIQLHINGSFESNYCYFSNSPI